MGVLDDLLVLSSWWRPALLAIVGLAFLGCCYNNHDSSPRHAEDAQQQPPPVQVQVEAMLRQLDHRSAAAASASEEDCCSICLGQFEDGDMCSVMPACRHHFHTDCIAAWFKASNNTCPLCRAPLQCSCTSSTVVAQDIV
ncbi:unnamed protein product [Urochloa humidicola]